MIEPKISCLMVTKDLRRITLLKRSTLDFCRQTYPNKELLIVSDGSEEYARQIEFWINSLKRDDIRHIYVPGERQLGTIRNISVNHAHGEYVCQWDDDDMNHPDRLLRQFRHMQAQHAKASLFEDQLQYFYDTQELLWVSWKPDLIPGTLMCELETLRRFPYFDLSHGEDACLREALRINVKLAVFSGEGYLNMYTYSGLNVYPRKHHESIRYSHDPGYIVDRIEPLLEHLPAYGLEADQVQLVARKEHSTKRVVSRVSRWSRKTRHSVRLYFTNNYRPAPEN